MTLKHILLFGGVIAAEQKIREHTQKLKETAPDDDDYDFAEDDDDDPSDFSPDQFLNDDSFLQTKSKMNSKDIHDDAEEHYFNTVEGDDDEEDDDEDGAMYDDSFVQIALKTHVEFDDMMAKGKLDFLHAKNQGPDDDDYDFAEDDDDDPADFSVGQFLDDDDSFIQTHTREEDDDDDYADDRLGAGEFMPASFISNDGDAVADEEDEESDDSVHQVLLQEARRRHKHHAKAKAHHKKHKHQSAIAKKHILRQHEREVRGTTDVYDQLAAFEKAHPDFNDNKNWSPVTEDEDEDGESFLQLNDDIVEDDEDGLADDRLDNNNEKASEWTPDDDDDDEQAFIQVGDKPAEAQPAAVESTESTKETADTDDTGDASDEVSMDEDEASDA